MKRNWRGYNYIENTGRLVDLHRIRLSRLADHELVKSMFIILIIKEDDKVKKLCKSITDHSAVSGSKLKKDNDAKFLAKKFGLKRSLVSLNSNILGIDLRVPRTSILGKTFDYDSKDSEIGYELNLMKIPTNSVKKHELTTEINEINVHYVSDLINKETIITT